MTMRASGMKEVWSLTMGVVFSLAPVRAAAHCDGIDGPVVSAAKEAVEKGDVTPALIWVKAGYEDEVRGVFRNTLEVREYGPKAREVADAHFFETLVRLHRAGEGAPYTGLKPSGRDLGLAIPAADRALERGDIAPVRELLTGALQSGLYERFKRVAAERRFKAADLRAGRAYVRSYVEYIHYVERLYEAAQGPARGHFEGAEEGRGEGHAR